LFVFRRDIPAPVKGYQTFFPHKIYSAHMPDKQVAGLCTGCGAPNPGKKLVCPECGASLVVADDSPATVLPHNNTGTGNQERNRRNTMLIAGGAVFLIIIIAALVATGMMASVFPQMVVGTYRENGDPVGLSLTEIQVKSDGTFSGPMFSHGTWSIEGNQLKVAYTETRYSQPPCRDALIPALCPIVTSQVPTGTTASWNIGWNTLEQNGNVWHKGETGRFGLWTNY